MVPTMCLQRDLIHVIREDVEDTVALGELWPPKHSSSASAWGAALWWGRGLRELPWEEHPSPLVLGPGAECFQKSQGFFFFL
jgi:hypothetical protein